MPMLRTILWWVTFIPATVFFSLAAIAAGFFDKTGNTSHNLNRIWAKTIMLASGCRINIKGLQNLRNNTGMIIVSNHQSGFDIYAYTAYLPIQIRWIAKKELFKIPLMGPGMKASRYISINRENPREALKNLKEASLLVKKGASAVIFPEGTRTPDGRLKNFKKGFFRLVKMAKSPVIPITINGTFNIMKKKSWRIHPQTITIRIGRPISYEEIKNRSEDEILNVLRQTIEDNLDRHS